MKKQSNTTSISKKSELVKKSEPLRVGVGKKIVIKVNEEIQSWEIVGIGKTDIPKGKLSFTAPLIQAILGAKVGDTIKTKIVDNDFTIVIKEIKEVS